MKILSIFHVFSKKDWHWMHKFVHSPVFNQHESVQKLYQFLSAIKPRIHIVGHKDRRQNMIRIRVLLPTLKQGLNPVCYEVGGMVKVVKVFHSGQVLVNKIIPCRVN